jgi:hypothetical protein
MIPRAQIETLIAKHARIAVLELQHQNDSYTPTPYEANALKNMHHILSQFAQALIEATPAPPPEKAKPTSND